jgi:hydroxyacylglutathione hydrolase
LKTWNTKTGYRIIRLLSSRSNVFLLTNGETNILIDTSVSRLWNKLVKRLDKLAISHIDYLILTHAHFDHAGNAQKIKEKYGALVIVQKNESSYLSTGDNILPEGTTVFTRPVINIFGRRLFSAFRYQPCQYDLLVDSMFDLKDFGFNAYLMHTPGHTTGSMSVIVDNEIALVGDTMFGVLPWSVFPPYAQDVRQMIQSWGKLLETECSVFIPSHGSANSRALVQKDFNKRVK